MQQARHTRLTTAKTGFEMGIPFNELNRVLDLGFKPIACGDDSYLPARLQKVTTAQPLQPKQLQLRSATMNSEPPLPAADSPLSSTFGARLVTLSDGRPGLRGGIHVTASAPGKDAVLSVPDPSAPTAPSVPNPSSTLDFISSDETLDRYGEIISAAGWSLDNYRRNPVFQNSHQYGDIIFTLGKALITEVRTVADRQVLFQRIEFATEANPMARIAYALYSRGFLKTVSVGFIPLRWEDGSTSSSSSSSSSIPFRRKYLEQELLEVSAVAIPANPNALALALKSGAVEKSDLRDLADLLHQALDPRSRSADFQSAVSPISNRQPSDDSGLPLAEPASPSIHQSINPSIHPLLALAREVRDLIKRA
ncbi:MAG TPA: HK97 family phage prohead protease [Candidatus Acidoferrum sp.]|jgi:hypothetical protein|nr:HK97 family phage prohead protease [Candidatus Acidoferrum sp.]